MASMVVEEALPSILQGTERQLEALNENKIKGDNESILLKSMTTGSFASASHGSRCQSISGKI
jgi:hypothetical protein